MKNKIYNFFIIIFISSFFSLASYSIEQFNFDVTNIEILEEGNIFKGTDKGIIKSDNGIIIIADTFEYNKALNILNANGNVKIEDTIQDYVIFAEDITYLKNQEKILTKNNSRAIYQKGKTINADNFEYNSELNILNANGNVKIEDTIQDYVIFAEDITYLKNQEKILTKGLTKSIIESKYKINSEDITFLLNEKKLSSNKKTIIKDNSAQVYNLERFVYLIDSEILKGDNILLISNFGLPKSDKIYFSNAIINLKNQSFTAKDTNIELHNEIFGNYENNPRLKGVSSKRDGNLTVIKKGIFTSCKKSNEKCTPWSIQAGEVKHDKDKKQLIYDNALLKIYDIPVLYFPKFFHPDPTVSRQTGFLKPELNNSNILGNSITIPYYFVNANNKDYTLTPTLFDSNIQMIQAEYREVDKNYKLTTDFGFTKGYESSLTKKKKDISHFFGKLDLDLNLQNFISSDLSLSIQNVSDDTYLKIFDANIANNKLKPNNFDILNSEIKLSLDHEKYNFVTGIQSFENLQLKDSDRYQYIFPYYNLEKIISQNYMHGFLSLTSNGTNELKNTNNLRSKIINDFSYKGFDMISNLGIKNNLNLNLKNLNSVGKNDSEYKSSPQIELMTSLELKSTLPMSKKTSDHNNLLTPKMSLRFSPSEMKDYSSSERQISTDNISSDNRLGTEDTFETGKSLTIGFDYKKEKLKDINRYFELKLATVLRDKEEKFIPKTTTLNKKQSNLFGTISNSFSENFNLNYNFAIDNDLSSFEYNKISAKYSVNNFYTSFNFIEEGGEMGSSNILENTFKYTLDEKNSFSFSTRRNRKINLTEYYDLVYQYKNDCLSAGIKYNKTYYEDRDLKPNENLFFTISLFPLTSYEQKVSK